MSAEYEIVLGVRFSFELCTQLLDLVFGPLVDGPLGFLVQVLADVVKGRVGIGHPSEPDSNLPEAWAWNETRN